jgi:hypothetical protein
VTKIGSRKISIIKIKISQKNNPLKRIEMRNIWIALICLLYCPVAYSDAIYVPSSHTELQDIGANTHATIDTFIASKGQPGGLAALNGSGTVEISGYIAQNNGTGTSSQLTNVSIVSGTGTLSGIPAPYIAQTNGTSTGGTHSNVLVAGSSSVQSTSTSDSYLSGNFAVGSSTPSCKFLVLASQLSGHVKYVDTQALIEKNGNTALEIASNSSNAGSLVFSDESATGGIIAYSHILDKLSVYVGSDLTSLGSPQFTINSSGSVTASNLITGWRAGSTYGYGLLNLASTGDIVFTPTYDNSTKSGTITASLTAASSAKPNLLQDGVLKASAPGTINFNTNFNVTSDGSVTVKNLVQQVNGTASGTQLTSVSIVSGTSTLSGVDSPYIAQTSGTATLLVVGSASVSHNGAAITGGTPIGVDICIGDNDTGINWVEDGKFQLKTNSNILATLDSSAIPSTFDIGTSGHSVNVTHYGTFSCKNQIESKSGGIKFPDGTTQLTSVFVAATSTVKTDTFTSSSTSFGTITGLSKSITLNASTNKVLVIAMVSGYSNTYRGVLRLLRNGTSIGDGDTAGNRSTGIATLISSAIQHDAPVTPIIYLDSPGTTTVTYSIHVKTTTAGTIYINRSEVDNNAVDWPRTSSSLNLIEIR